LAQERPNPLAGIPRADASIAFRAGRFVPRGEGRTKGKAVEGHPVTAKTEIPLDPGVTIGLGQGTTVRFDLS
jgi:hypothetical protein